MALGILLEFDGVSFEPNKAIFISFFYRCIHIYFASYYSYHKLLFFVPYKKFLVETAKINPQLFPELIGGDEGIEPLSLNSE
ncbi:MAG: hypothetical protein MRECE_11c014 [Mycoplasmataceae bacterium CE_OT135]|nr:MAG: hypothetical protein MRECE_11c014 [Mycoplasmataceae bacterium CE_OT135]